MDSTTAIPAWLKWAGFLLFLVSIFAYGRLLRQIAKDGGKVRTDHFGAGDFVLTALLIAWFATAIFRGFHTEPKPVHGADIINGAVFFLMIVTLLCSFMGFRGVNLLAQFGFLRINFAKAVGLGLLLLVAAYPLVGFVSVLTQSVLGAEAKPQELVKYFVDASQKGNYGAIMSTILMGVLFAPVAEEFIFRGYFYGILKRHLGMIAGMVINASLFAAIHLNESSLPALFVLAICFTIAYEFTGSIVVCMCMHSLFNFTNLALLLYTVHQS